MSDLEFFELPLEKIKLERLDVWNKKHIKATRGLRDFKARTMCYDLQGLVDDKRHNRDHSGNQFLVQDRELEEYIGYLYISDRHAGGERVLSYIVNKKLRNRGYGKVMLTSVSDFLFEEGLAQEVQLYIKDNNVASKRLALSCGFDLTGHSSAHTEKFSKKR